MEVFMSTIEAAIIALLLSQPAVPIAQEPKSTKREVITTAGTVELIDRFTRALTLRTSSNTTQTVFVEPGLTLFDELRPGDRVTVRLSESVIVTVRPGLKPSNPVDTTASAPAADGSGKSAVVQQLKAAVTVESVDPKTSMIVYKAADNRRIARAVLDPKLLEGLKAGDVIEIIYTRERAVDLQRAR
jgi:hypothetical protein